MNTILHLKRPLAFFDLETTGTDVSKDRIIEIAILKMMPDGTIIGNQKKNKQTLGRKTLGC